jgi:hypothetical protein
MGWNKKMGNYQSTDGFPHANDRFSVTNRQDGGLSRLDINPVHQYAGFPSLQSLKL